MLPRLRQGSQGVGTDLRAVRDRPVATGRLTGRDVTRQAAGGRVLLATLTASYREQMTGVEPA